MPRVLAHRMAMSRPLLIVGAGGHGRVVAEIAIAAGIEVLGFLDRSAAVGASVGGKPVLGRALPDLRSSHGPLAVAVFIAVGDNDTRARLFQEAHGAGYDLPTLIHPSAVVSPSACIGAGSVLMAGAIINADARLGRFTIINTAASIDHDCVLEDGAQICPGARAAGTVRLGANAFVGTGAIVIPGIRVGAGAIVGAGAVVLRDVAPDTTVVGNPARVVKR